ncbi:AAA family ATPase, partial [Nostoc sp. NIES-2111]
MKGWRKRGVPQEIATREALATLMRVGWGQINPVFRQLFTSRFIPGAKADQIASFDELQRITVSPENAWRLQNVFGDIDVSDLLPRVSVPTLVFHARGDQIAPYASGRTFATTISGARLVELDSANHILMENEPAFRTFVGEVRGFANMVAARSQTPVSVRNGPTSKAPEGRRQITALTCEIINPDSFLDYTDPEGERDLDPFREQAIELVARHGGTMVGTAHNEFTAAFGADRAREDHALQACRAALDLVELTKTAGGGALRARIGIDTGEVVIQAAQDGVGLDVSGAPVTVSRRLAHTLRRPVVATTGRTYDAAGGLVEMSRLTREEAPSFPADWRVFELGRERREISRWQLRAPITGDSLIGRDTELDVLAEAARKARLGQGQAVAVLAEAGLGKSRTTHEFLASPDASGFQLIECGAQELDQAVAWSLLKNFVRSLFGINHSDTAEVVTSKLHQGLGRNSAELLPPLLFVLDLPATGQGWTSLSALGKSQRVQEAVMRAVALVMESEPTALLLEDLHWADAESLDVIRGVAGATRTLPLLMIATSRPEGCAQWLLSEPFWQLRLSALGRESTRDLVESLLGVDESVVDVGHVIAQRTGGVPLFVEEVVRELAQSGQIVGERGAYKAVGPVTDIAVPPTVQSVIAARLGKLSEQDRAVVEAAAVIGRETPADLLQVVVGLPTTAIHESLSRLISAGFLAERPSTPVRTARFEHALIEEVAYRGMLSKTRRMLHKRVFDALDRDSQGDVERLAEHALRAELWPAGARYLLQAAQKALARSAHGAALEMVARGLDALKRLPESTERNRLELKLQEARGLGW